MERALWVMYLALAALAGLQAVLVALQSWEHRRFARSRMRHLDAHRPQGRAMVFCPCKGVDLGLENNLRAILRQDYDDYEVVFVVESDQDPAYALVAKVMAEHPDVQTRVVVAGPAQGCGQKVHNLRTATANLPRDVEFVAFVDSDARPRPEWLRSLLRLDRPGVGASTGYRWFVPLRPTLANYLLYSINCGIALLFGPSRYHLIWGGSWAMRRELFEQLGVREAWQGTLSDDLVVSGLLARARLGAVYHPPCMVASPLDYPGHSMLSFLRRQYLVARFYSPNYWLLALVTSTMTNCLLLASLGMLIYGLRADHSLAWTAGGVLAMLYGIGVFRGWLRQDLARLFFPHLQPVLQGPQRFDMWAGPLANFVHWIGILGSLIGRDMVWRGIRYRLQRGGQIELLGSGPVVEHVADEEDLAPALTLPTGRQQQTANGIVPRKKAG
jgi:ceramide glucosyltransferase